MVNAHTSAAPASGELRRISVLLPLPLDGAYDYLVPAALDLPRGQLLRVPLGGREVLGCLWSSEPGDPDLPAEKLKAVAEIIDAPPLPEVSLAFIEWVAAYTMSPPGAILKMLLSSPQALEPPREILGYRRSAVVPDELRMTKARRLLLAEAGDFPRPAAELARAAGVGVSVIKGLVAAGALEAVAMALRPQFDLPDPQAGPVELSPVQRAAADDLLARVGKGFSVALLDGVTGSGKTEVYFEAMARAIAQQRQVLVLLPEIALSHQWLERFRRRFGALPAEWHSDLTQVQRRETWRAVADGTARIVVGARSALFLPYPDLGLIVVDEEHESAYKQEDGVTYHARDMSVVRARLGEIPVVLVSATPSLESLVNAKGGRYSALHLPERHRQAALPRIEVVDLRREPPPRLPRPGDSRGQSFLSPPLRQALGETFAAGEQALLYLNRRGYAPLTLCQACGHRMACPNCSAWLVEHRLIGRLQCHHCGYFSAIPKTCPACEAEESFVACGPGVERLAEEAALLFPDQRCQVLTSDTLTGPRAAGELLRAMTERRIDLLIGTQIIAKGHHFPWLTLVGVVDADLGLEGGDLRAAERTYQLLHQVAGRAGRDERAGRVFLQTYRPDHRVIAALVSGQRDRFVEAEIEERRQAKMPPFARLSAVIVSGPDAGALDAFCRDLSRRLPKGGAIEVLGPAPAAMALLRGRHRRRYLVKTERESGPQSFIARWLRGVKPRGGIRLQIDIDPYSFF